MALKKSSRPAALEEPRDRDAVLEGEPALIALIDHVAHADDELVADLAADLLQHHEAETTAVLPRAAEAVGAPVGLRRQELADQMPAGEHLDAVETAVAAAPGRRPIGLHHAADVVLVHLLREAAMQGLADRRRADGRQPMRRIGFAATAEMRDLHIRAAPCAWTRSEKRCRCGMMASVPTFSCRKMLGESRSTLDEPPNIVSAMPPLRLLLMIELVGLGRHASGLEPAGVARAHDAVLENERLDLKRLEQRILPRGTRSPDRARLKSAPPRSTPSCRIHISPLVANALHPKAHRRMSAELFARSAARTAPSRPSSARARPTKTATRERHAPPPLEQSGHETVAPWEAVHPKIAFF